MRYFTVAINYFVDSEEVTALRLHMETIDGVSEEEAIGKVSKKILAQNDNVKIQTMVALDVSVTETGLAKALIAYKKLLRESIPDPIMRINEYIKAYEDAPSWGGPTQYPSPPNIEDLKAILNVLQ